MELNGVNDTPKPVDDRISVTTVLDEMRMQVFYVQRLYKTNG